MQVHDVEAPTGLDLGSARTDRTIAVHGGLGDPDHSVIRLYAPTLRRFRATLVAVDPAAADSGRRVEVARRLGLTYSQCMTPVEFGARLDSGWTVDAALILTPVATHLPILAQHAHANRVPAVVVVEKPAVGLDQVDELAAVTAELGPQRCYFIDTAMVAPSIRYAFGAGIVERIGPLRSIVAIGLDNPWTAAPDLHEFTLAAKQGAINERGVLDPARNGGAGAGFDMGIHAVTGLAVILDRMGLSLADVETNSVRLELADLRGWRRGAGGETHLLVEGRLGDVPVVIEAGKGADTWDRRVELYGERGVCALGFGTVAHAPGIWLRTDADEHVWRFADRDTGYSHHLRDLAVLVGAADSDLTLTPADSGRHMLTALQVMADWYRTCGTAPPDREPIPLAPGHANPHLDAEQRAVRRRLDQVNRDVLGFPDQSLRGDPQQQQTS